MLSFKTITLLLCINAGLLLSQDKLADSLLLKINSLKEDSTKVKSLNDLAWHYFTTGGIDSARKYAKQAKTLGEKVKFIKGAAKASSIVGSTFYLKGDLDQALDYYFISLKLRESIGDKLGASASLNNIALIFDSRSDYAKSLQIHQRSLKIKQEIGDKAGEALSYSNIGIIYFRTHKYKEALDYHFKAIKVAREVGDKKAEANGLGNISNVYRSQKKFKEAVELDKASYKMRQEMGDRQGVAISLNNLAASNLFMGNYDEARKYFTLAMEKGQEISFLALLIETNEGLALCDSAKGDFKNAYLHYKKRTILRDSLLTAEGAEKASKIEALYESEKKDKEIQLLNKEKEKQGALALAENKKNNIIIFSIATGLLLLLVFSLFLYNRFKITKKQKHIIEVQKEMVEEKQKEIVDSITYAKRLQQAILPPVAFINEHLPDSFVLYKPKDIVAGDFYWAEKIGDLFLIAAADCTGHGVPGAMVSVVCSNALNRAVKEFKITEPGQILDKVRELVIETFEKSESEVKDGMDISLCSLDLKTNLLKWAGANNALWYIKNDTLHTVAADKQPIGKYAHQTPFTTQSIQLSEKDSIYIFTDGYADQFGGSKGKKFKSKQLQEKISILRSDTMVQQKAALLKIFEDWKVNTEQIDDVLVIGIRI